MIKTLIAHTFEVDEVEEAISEIIDSINPRRNLLKNSIGIMACSLDFIENGTVRGLCSRLPFDVVGIDSLGCAVSGDGGANMLALAVLTSDDAFFSAGLSESMRRDYEEPLAEVYSKTSARLSGKPALILAFAPFVLRRSVDYFVKYLDLLSGGVPLFGGMPSDFTTEFRKPLVIYNGEAYADSLAIVLVSGNVSPKFTLSAISTNKTIKMRAIVTASEGNILKKINDELSVSFIRSLGLFKDDNTMALRATPIVLHFDDGAPPALRVIGGVTPEGYLFLGGTAPVGCAITIGAVGYDDIMETASIATADVTRNRSDFLLVISCMTRNFVMGLDNMDEINHFRATLGGDIPFLFMYTAGELCPVEAKGAFINRYHNLTLVTCAF
ncbi:MAG: FIST C-terminal domain-containing protein [Synergistaceae bacterium]|jgi:hypothetical protein|nr:FIST C-terminal domain-containing protein [Synergistaceae bacterium]